MSADQQYCWNGEAVIPSTLKSQMENSPEELCIESIVHEIGATKSGKRAEEAISLLNGMLERSLNLRRRMFSSKRLLNVICASLAKRSAPQSTLAMRQRFKTSDTLLLECLSRWEKDYSATFPVFQSWLSEKRSKGLKVPDASQSTGESEALHAHILEEEVRAGMRELCAGMRSLEALLDLFTPELEEAFSETNLSKRDVDERVRESKGENDELFATAREKFNYLSKKVLERLERKSEELLRICPSSALGLEGQAQVSKATTSRVFQHFVLLLLSEGPGRPVKRVRRTEDTEYDEWF